ncbi:MAG TPA: PepSY-associated TM helix domain-containing protein, partial [Candidatus Glassbacteria bacterium]|nr:PepSY-associated TM helix domain-containing protein [Candidatus Glassbacteria bacterium]
GELGLKGRRRPPRVQDDGRVLYTYERPGTTLAATLAADRNSLEITSTEYNLRETVVGYHFIHDYGSGGVWDLWALLLDLGSVGCIVFALSGVCIWATSPEQDRLGRVMLAAGLFMTAGMLLYLMFTK